MSSKNKSNNLFNNLSQKENNSKKQPEQSKIKKDSKESDNKHKVEK